MGRQALVVVGYSEPAAPLLEGMESSAYPTMGWSTRAPNIFVPPPSPPPNPLVQGGGSEMIVSFPLPQRIFAGQPDSTDASHFMIEYEWPDGTRGTIDGYLLDDNCVKMSIRPGVGDIAWAEHAAESNPRFWDHIGETLLR